MNILHVITSVDERTGGPIECIKQHARALERRGHAIEVATLDTPGEPCTEGFEWPLHSLGPTVSYYRYSPRFVPWLRAHAGRYDCVVVNGLWQYGAYGTWSALRESDTPYYVYPHGMLDPWFKHAYPLKHLKKCLMWPWSEYRVLRDARAVLFTCEEERLLARESFSPYRCNEVVMNFGTAAPPSNTAEQLATFIEAYPDLRGKRIVLFLSRIHEKKGCDLLLEAFAQVADRSPDLHLVMAGPDVAGWQATLTELSERLGIGHRITWTGMLTGAAKWGAYRAAEVLILPSHQENFGLVVTEAMACGVPVLISNKVNIWREVIADGAGLVEEDTLAGTRTLLERWCALSEEERNMMSTRAIRCFNARFEVARAAESFCAAIASSQPALERCA